MHKVRVLAEMLTRPVDAQRGIVYLQTGDRRSAVSYAQLLQRARQLLALLNRQGLQPGDLLIIFVRDNRAFVDVFWACQLGGFVAVPLAGSVQSENLRRLQRVAGLLDSPWLFSDRELYLRLKQHHGEEVVAASQVCLLENIGQLGGEARQFSARPDDLALIQFSSGSTGEPKGVQLSHANLLTNIAAISTAAQISRADATLSWMPLSHDMGLIGFHLVPLFNGIDQVLMDTERFVRRPAQWLQAAQEEQSTLLCSPNFGYQHYLNAIGDQPMDLDLNKVRLIFNGAEPVSATVSRNFLRRLSACGLSEKSMFPVYGLAEAGLAVTFPRPGSGLVMLPVPVEGQPQVAAEGVCLGMPVADCELRICDEAGRVLDTGHTGHVQIRGGNVTRGYYRCPNCDRAAFIDGWLDTGDIGLMTDQGLVIAGRGKEVIFVDGQNWYPQDIEHALQVHGGIDAGKVAVSAVRSADNAADNLLVFIQHRRATDEFAERLSAWQAALTAATGLHAQAIIPVHSLPRTSSGKLQRYKLAEDYVAGRFTVQLAALSEWQGQVLQQSDQGDNPVERQLLDVCRQLFPGHALQNDQNLFELGADSLMLVRIHEEIDSLYPGKVAVTDLFDYPTIKALAAYIKA